MSNQDLMERTIDDRARRAAADVRRVASSRPTPRVRRVAPDRRPGVVAVAVCAVVALVAGLYLISGRNTVQLPSGPTGQRLLTIDDPSGGLHITTIHRSGGATTQADSVSYAVFASDGDAPDTIVTLVRFAPRVFAVSPGLHDYTETVIDGRHVVIATAHDGRRVTTVSIGDHDVQFTASGADDQLLRQLAAAVQVDDQGVADIDPTALPAGLHPVGTGSITDLAPGVVTGVAMQGVQPGAVMVSYSSTTGGWGASLTIAAASPAEIWALLGSGTVTATNVHGDHGWIVDTGNGIGPSLAWIHGGSFLVLTANGASEQGLIALAATVRPVEADDLPADVRSDVAAADTVVGITTPADTAPTDNQADDAPADTDPPTPPPTAPASVHDVPLEHTEVPRGANEVVIAGELTDGFTYRLDVVVLSTDVQLTPGPENGTELMGFGALDVAVPITDSTQFADLHGTIDGQDVSSVAVVTDDPDAARLEVVRSNGDRYLIDLTSTAGHPEIRFAGISLPTDQYVSARLVDGNGRTIASPTTA